MTERSGPTLVHTTGTQAGRNHLRPTWRALAATAAAAMLTSGCIDSIFPIQAATPKQSERALPTGFEIVVFETERCQTCLLFRRDLAPRYEASIRGGTAPLRYVDLTRKTAAKDGRHDRVLARPLTIVPTAVLVEDGREFARIEGYTGPDNFFQMVSYAFKNRSGPANQASHRGPITRN